MQEIRYGNSIADRLMASNIVSNTNPVYTSGTYRATGYLQPTTTTTTITSNQVFSTSPAQLGRASISPKVESTTAYVDQVIAKSRASRIEAERQRQSGIDLGLPGGITRISQFGTSTGVGGGGIERSYVETESRFETSKNLGYLDKTIPSYSTYTGFTEKPFSVEPGLGYTGNIEVIETKMNQVPISTTTTTTTNVVSSENKRKKKDLQDIILLMAVEIERLKQQLDSSNYRIIEIESKYSSSQVREGQLADLNMRLREYESKISILEKENDSWKSRFFALDNEARDLRARGDSTFEYQRRITYLEQEIENLRQRYNSKERELEEVSIRSENAKKSGQDREIKDLTGKFLQEREYLESELRRKDAEIQDLRLRNTMKTGSDQEVISLRELLRTREREIERLKQQGSSNPGLGEEKAVLLAQEIERLRNQLNQKNEDYEILKKKLANAEQAIKIQTELNQRLTVQNSKLRKNAGGWCC